MSDLIALARKIKERQRLIEHIVEFVSRIIVNYGENRGRSVGSCHTHTVWELKNLANFSFKCDFGQTMMGGNDIYILYFGRLVFHVYYQISVKECKVMKFAQDNWLPVLKKLMKSPKAAITQLNRKKQARLQ